MSGIAKGLVLVVAVLGLAGCGSSPTQPNGPVTEGPGGGPAPGGGLVALAIAGGVHDSAFRPLADAVVEVLDGPQAGAKATTDAKGEFVLWATVDASTRFGVSKDGYVTAIVLPWPCDACPLHAWFHFFIKPLAQTVNLAGNYTLTFIADSACTAIPSALRTRTYPVTIAPVDAPPYPAGTFFEATVPGVPHWTDRGSIPIATAGDFVWFILGEDGSPYFVEEVAPGAYIHFDGGLRFSVGAAAVSTISTSLDGWADYWGPAVANPVHCVSANHRMTLTKR